MGKAQLPNFSSAVRVLAGSETKLPTGTYWRYMNGHIPAFGRLLLKFPELAEALARDARELAKAGQPDGEE